MWHIIRSVFSETECLYWTLFQAPSVCMFFCAAVCVVARLTWSIEATHKTSCHLHSKRGFRLHSPILAFSCLCAAWPLSFLFQATVSQCKEAFKGTVCSNQVRGPFYTRLKDHSKSKSGRRMTLPFRLDRILAQSKPVGLCLCVATSLRDWAVW